MTATILETSGVSTEFDEERDHIVCHCTNKNIAWCKLDVTDMPFVDVDSSKTCPLCAFVEDKDPNSCPWGCSCEECGGEDEEEPEFKGLSANFVVVDEWSSSE